MPRTKTPNRPASSAPARSKAHRAPQAKPEVLARFTPAQLKALEARAVVDDDELRELEALADAAAERVKTVEQALKALRAARRLRGISQTQLDEQTGIGRANLSRLENLHLENPTLDTVLRYAQAVGLKLQLVKA